MLRFAQKLRGARVLEAHPVIETPAGEEGQVDYAHFSCDHDGGTL